MKILDKYQLSNKIISFSFCRKIRKVQANVSVYTNSGGAISIFRSLKK
jgi:hypothetical protein